MGDRFPHSLADMVRGEIELEGGDRYSYQQVPAERGTKKTRVQSSRKPDFLLVNTVFFDQLLNPSSSS